MGKGIYPFIYFPAQKCRKIPALSPRTPGSRTTSLGKASRVPRRTQRLQYQKLQKWLPASAWLQGQGGARDPRAPLPGTEAERATDEEADASVQVTQ